MILENSTNNKRIAKNTLLLYFRMILTMVVSLYTSRVVLNTLGIADFGTYNVVGGVVVMFSFLSTAFTTATQRFLTFELGTNNFAAFRQIFSLSIASHIFISIFILLIAETIGLWFLNEKMVIPEDRLYAANWVYQLSICAFIVNLLRTPYNAAIIAHERMAFFALISFVEVLLKLIIVYILVYMHYDKLILYSILTVLVSVFTSFLYYLYCRRNFPECEYFFFWNKGLFYKLTSFSGWSLFGNLAAVSSSQGVNILMNLFFGVVVNSAMGIATQVSSSVNQFVSSFQMAFNPQITKYFAQGNFLKLHQLVYSTAKYSFFMLFIISLPVILLTEPLLQLWLQKPPPYSVDFTRLMIISLLIDTLSGPLWMLAQATGKIRKYQILISVVFFLNIVLAYLVFLGNSAAVYALYIRVLVSILLLVVRLRLLSTMMKFKPRKFFEKVILPTIVVALTSIPVPYMISITTSGIIGLIYTTSASVACVALFIYLVGLTTAEREFVKTQLYSKLNKVL